MTQRTIEVRTRDIELQRTRLRSRAHLRFRAAPARSRRRRRARAVSGAPAAPHRAGDRARHAARPHAESDRRRADHARRRHAASPPPIVPEGLPSDLLLRRPDIVEAEQRLAAANARIGVARASLFPRIALTGYLGSESGPLGDLFSGPALIWQLAFGLAQPIFQGGRLRGEVDAVQRARAAGARAISENAADRLRRSARSTVAQSRSREVYAAENERVAALAETLRLARIRFENGLSSQLEVLDAESNLLQAELNRVDALRAQRARSRTSCARWAAGGWATGRGYAAGRRLRAEDGGRIPCPPTTTFGGRLRGK